MEKRRASDADLAALDRWIEGEMTGDEEALFEERVSGDDALREEFVELAEVDLAVRGLAAPPRTGILPLLPWIAAAAALLAVAWVGFATVRTMSAPVPFDVAVLPAAASLERYAAELGVPPELVPEYTRGGGAPETVAAFVAAVDAAERTRTEAALGASASEVVAGRYRVPIRLGRAGHVLLLVFAADGTFVRRHPVDGDPLVPAGETRYLPAAPLRTEAHDRIAPDRSYLLPIGAGSATVLVAVSARPWGGRLVALERALDSPGVGRADRAARASAWLEERGFATRTLTVVEPE